MHTGKIFYKPINQTRINPLLSLQHNFSTKSFFNYFNNLQKFSLPKFGKIKINNLLSLIKTKLQLHNTVNIFAQYEYIMLQHLWKSRFNFGSQWIKGKTKRNKIMFGTIAVSVYDWNAHRINDNEILKHATEFDYIYNLKNKTLICSVCYKRRKIDSSIPGMCYCECPKKNYDHYVYDDWKPYLERQDVLIWRKEENGHYQYKVYGVYSDVSAEDFLLGQIDCNYRKRWDSTAKVLDIIESEPETNSDIVYWETVWPRFFTNRDYVFNRRYLVSKENKMIIILSKVTEHKSCPIKPEKYRVNDYWSCMIIKPCTDIDKPGIEFILTYYDNPGVNIPNSVTNWVAGSAMPDFLSKLREAAKGYKAYLQKTDNVKKDLTVSLVKNSERNIETTEKGSDTENWKYFYPYYYLG